MKKLLAILVVMLLSLALTVGALAQEIVNVFNWEDYICPEALKLFTQETGIEVNYSVFAQNEDMIVAMQANDSVYDVVFPSDYMIQRLLVMDVLAEIDWNQLPNAQANMMDNMLDPVYDAGNAHSVPYMWGTLGIVYNTKLVEDEITSWKDLLDPRYARQIFMMDSIRDSMGLALKVNGYSMNTTDPMALIAARDFLLSVPQKAYQMDEVKDEMIAGEGMLAVMYSGDAQYAMNGNEDLAYAVPQEGSNMWVDCMVIPSKAPHFENAMKFIDFMCRPDIAQLNCEYISYSSPNKAAIDLMGEAYTSNPLMNPAEEILANCEYYIDLDASARVLYETMWQQVRNNK